MSKIHYQVQMIRPDRKRVVNRHIFTDHKIQAVSNRQLGGYLTHTLFADSERGDDGTHYTITERDGEELRVFTLRKVDGKYYSS